jgi:hypothetical protein
MLSCLAFVNDLYLRGASALYGIVGRRPHPPSHPQAGKRAPETFVDRANGVAVLHASVRQDRVRSGRGRHLHHVTLTVTPQFVEQIPILAARLVSRDPIQRHEPERSDVDRQRGRDLGFGAKWQVLQNVSRSATCDRLVAFVPGLMEIQLMIQKCDPAGSHADEEYTDLAVVFLTEPAVVLPRYTSGVYPLLCVCALVDDASSIPIND